MKKILLVLGIVGVILFAIVTKTEAKRVIKVKDIISKTDSIPTDSILHIAEVMPEFEGGIGEMMKFISSNLKYPIQEGCGIQGRVTVRFVVTRTGKIEQVKILRSVDPSCDKEAIRVIKSMPEWIPGKQDGKEVNVYYTLPISFRMR